MTKFLLLILLCLAYLSTAGIILTPVTFADEPTETTAPLDSSIAPADNTQTTGLIIPEE